MCIRLEKRIQTPMAVNLIITMITWIQTSALSIKNSLSLYWADIPVPEADAVCGRDLEDGPVPLQAQVTHPRPDPPPPTPHPHTPHPTPHTPHPTPLNSTAIERV